MRPLPINPTPHRHPDHNHHQPPVLDPVDDPPIPYPNALLVGRGLPRLSHIPPKNAVVIVNPGWL